MASDCHLDVVFFFLQDELRGKSVHDAVMFVMHRFECNLCVARNIHAMLTQGDKFEHYSDLNGYLLNGSSMSYKGAVRV